VENACGLAQRFHQDGFEAIITEALTLDTVRLYRQHLPRCLIVRLYVSSSEARRRGGTRPVYLTDTEFRHLHNQDRDHAPSRMITWMSAS
jgi:hypothetical protein